MRKRETEEDRKEQEGVADIERAVRVVLQAPYNCQRGTPDVLLIPAVLIKLVLLPGGRRKRRRTERSTTESLTSSVPSML